MTKNILIIDPDLGFVFWLGQLLDSARHHALPAKSVADAEALLDRFKVAVDLLIIGHSLANGEGFVENLRRSQTGLPVIFLCDQMEERPSCAGADAFVCKPSRLDQMSEVVWLEMVQNIFKRNEYTASGAE
jgi:DNA-binding response OmpR family regulator